MNKANASVKTTEANRDSSGSKTQNINVPQAVNSPIDRILHLQRTIGNQAVERLFRDGMIQTKPLAEQITPLLQRQEIEEEEKDLQMKPEEEEEGLFQAGGRAVRSDKDLPDLAARIQSMRTGGRPLPGPERTYYETRFGHDFSRVRIHTDSHANETAGLVNAKAFTLGRDVVFGAGAYAPSTEGGRRLLAHELTHVVQQRTYPPKKAFMLQRARLSAAECQGPIHGSLGQFVQQTQANPVNAQMRAARGSACVGTLPNSGCTLVHSGTPNPACTANGHGSPAVQFTALADNHASGRTAHIRGFFIDRDMPANWGAYNWKCECFTPPIAGLGQPCVFVPPSLEAEARQFNTSPATQIGGRPREEWRATALDTIIHETEHARFDTQTLSQPSPGACRFENIRDELSEIAATISEFPSRRDFLISQYALDPNRFESEQRGWFAYWILSGGENISGALRAIRCRCECSDADDYLRRTVDFATSGWSTYLKYIYHTELRHPRYSLNWPIVPPSLPPVQRPDPSIRPPAPERPRFGPLYVPRRDFNRELIESGESTVMQLDAINNYKL